MLPARTGVPAYTFTPRFCGLESRPLREEPPPFLCAIVRLLRRGNPRDLELGVGLPMPRLAAVVLPPPELEHHDLLASILRRDLGRDRRALHQRLPDLRRIAADE